MLEVQQGNGDAFAVLFDRYHRLVLVTALKILRDVGEAEEVTQNVFFEIYRAAGKFDPTRGNLKGWLLQYAYHRSINRRNYLLLRRVYNHAHLDDVVAREDGTNVTPRLPTQELNRLIEQALGSLKESERRTIRLGFFEGLTLKEVAERTEASLSNVRNHYYRGPDHLRAFLSITPVALRAPRVLLGEVNRAKA